MHRVLHVPTELPFCVRPLVVGQPTSSLYLANKAIKKEEVGQAEEQENMLGICPATTRSVKSLKIWGSA